MVIMWHRNAYVFMLIQMYFFVRLFKNNGTSDELGQLIFSSPFSVYYYNSQTC